MNKKGEFDFVIIILFVFLVFWMLGGVAIIFDLAYIKPIAAEKANEICKFQGFDQHKSFSRLGLFSENPVGIKCEYAERYTDLGVRIN